MTSLATVVQNRLLQRQAAIRVLLEKGAPAQRPALAEELLETEAALGRIAEGRFGRCDACGGAIGRQRLLALPAVRRCIECTAKALSVR